MDGRKWILILLYHVWISSSTTDSICYNTSAFSSKISNTQNIPSNGLYMSFHCAFAIYAKSESNKKTTSIFMIYRI